MYADTVEECREALQVAEALKRDHTLALREARRIAAEHGGCTYDTRGNVIRVSTRDKKLTVEVTLDGPLANIVVNAALLRLSSECEPG